MTTRGSLPLVSVIATCFNHEPFVVECLESIRAQTYPNVELIIFDDASHDRSVTLIRDWVERTGTPCTLVVHQQNQGVCRTRNEALRHAHGPYVASISTDDVWLPDKLADQVAQFESLPEPVGVLYGDAERMDEAGNPLPGTFIEHLGAVQGRPEGDLYETLLMQNFIPAMTTIVRRDCYAAVGPYDESLVYEDWDMWLRLARRYEFAYTPAIGARYRVHASSLSHRLTNDRAGADWWETDMHIFLKHIGHSPGWDAILWNRIARTAYRLNRPERVDYARANLRARPTPFALVLYVLCRTGVPYRRLARLKRMLNRVGDMLRLPRYPPRSSPTMTLL